MKLDFRGVARCVAAFLSMCVLAPAAAVASDIALTPLVADVLFPPTPVESSFEQYHLVYELRLENPTPYTVLVEKVDVLDERGNLLERLEQSIGERLSIGGRRGAEATSLGAGQFGVLFVHVWIWTNRNFVPKALAHRISGQVLNPSPRQREFTITVGETKVAELTKLVVGPPLLGQGFFAGDGCCDSIRHVRALLPLNGRFFLAQRFAIDWEQIGADHRLVHGTDLKDVKSYNIYGKDVIAVADGTVVDSRNDLAEQVPGNLPVGLPIDEADGNFVVLQMDNGAYALFAHMQPGSVTVSKGAKVKRGDVLGKVGNSGNTSAPHLHFHVMDGPSPLLSNGLPYVIDQFTMTATDPHGTADFDKAEKNGTPLNLMTLAHRPVYQKVLPDDLTVVEFSR
jgi:hypothetical protein